MILYAFHDVDDDAVVILLALLVAARTGTLQARAGGQVVRDGDVLERDDEARDGLGGDEFGDRLVLLTAGSSQHAASERR